MPLPTATESTELHFLGARGRCRFQITNRPYASELSASWRPELQIRAFHSRAGGSRTLSDRRTDPRETAFLPKCSLAETLETSLQRPAARMWKSFRSAMPLGESSRHTHVEIHDVERSILLEMKRSRSRASSCAVILIESSTERKASRERTKWEDPTRDS